jgi:hypothetical protein
MSVAKNKTAAVARTRQGYKPDSDERKVAALVNLLRLVKALAANLAYEHPHGCGCQFCDREIVRGWFNHDLVGTLWTAEQAAAGFENSVSMYGLRIDHKVCESYSGRLGLIAAELAKLEREEVAHA